MCIFLVIQTRMVVKEHFNEENNVNKLNNTDGINQIIKINYHI